MRRIPLALLAFVLTATSWLLAADTPTVPGAPEELPEIDGVVVERSNGTLMQVKVEGVRIVLRFFDDKHEQIKPDVDGAWVRVVPSNRGAERRVLVPSEDGMSLTHGVPLRGAQVFKLYINLTRKSAKGEAETHVVDYP